MNARRAEGRRPWDDARFDKKSENTIDKHRSFESWEALKVHVEYWLNTVADKKVVKAADGAEFATMERFAEEKRYLKALKEQPSFLNVDSFNRKVDAKGMLRVHNRYYSLPAEYAGREVQVRVVGDELEVFDAGHTIRKFDKTLGTSKVITYEAALDPKDPGFGNTIGAPPELKGVVSTPVNNPLRRSFDAYAKILGGCHPWKSLENC